MKGYSFEIQYCDLIGAPLNLEVFICTSATNPYEAFEKAFLYAKDHAKPHTMIDSIKLRDLYI